MATCLLGGGAQDRDESVAILRSWKGNFERSYGFVTGRLLRNTTARNRERQ